MYNNNQSIIFIDGQFIKASETKLDPFSQSLHYGYSVFEGMRSYSSVNGVKILKAQEHFERLKIGCELMGIPFNYSVEELVHLSYQLLEKNNFITAYIRPLVFCGPNLSLTQPVESSFLLAAWPWGKYFGDKKLRVCVSSHRRTHYDAIQYQTKISGHYVNSIMATTEARKRGFDEGLMLDENGFVAQGPGANFFYERDGVLYTPPVGQIFQGITRQTVFEICKELDIPVREKYFRVEELFEANSAFFCGTATEIACIDSIEGQKFNMEWEKSLGCVIQDAYKSLAMDKSYSVIV